MSPEKMIEPYFVPAGTKLGLAKSRLRRSVASMAPAGAHLRGFFDTLTDAPLRGASQSVEKVRLELGFF